MPTIIRNENIGKIMRNGIDYTSWGGGGGGGLTLEFFDTLAFSGNEYIQLPIKLKSPNTSYFIDFTTETQADATGEHTIFGINHDSHYNFIGIRYNNLRYQVGQNGGSTNVNNTWEQLTGRHTFLYDGSGHVLFDNGAISYTYSPNNTIGDDYYLVIASAKATPRTGATWKGLVHEFTVKDIPTDTVTHHYVPCAYMSGGQQVLAGLYDTVTDTFITTSQVQARNEGV